ncbi:hypothetical protein H0O00_02935, partial [Candidatus Micrarchaeota archaeon]|nr:hypothetical protein [Candidatus Micrarchaeota archaeon]
MKLRKGEEVKGTTTLRFSKSHIFSAAVIGMAATVAAVVLYFPGCETKVEGPMAVRGDGVCIAGIESYPYKRDIRTGAVLKDSSGKPVPNPSYSKEDCYRGDGVPDLGPDKASLKDPAGNPVADFRDTFTDKRAITLPLEDENSLDVVLKQISDQPCGKVDDKHPVLTRDKLSIPELIPVANLRKRFRTQEEVEKLHAQPGLFDKEGGDMYTVVVDYVETCDTLLPPCEEAPFEVCYCANLSECQPGPCPNGTIDPGEQCDPKSAKKLGGCKEGSHCDKCKCIKDKAVSTCNNGIFDRGKEDCDGSSTLARGGCREGQECVRCNCIDTPKPPAEITACTHPMNATDLTNRVAGAMLGHAGDLRTLLDSQDAIKVTVKFLVDTG